MVVLAIFIAQNNVRPALHFKILPPARALIASGPFSRINPRRVLTIWKGKANPLQAWTGPEGSRRL